LQVLTDVVLVGVRADPDDLRTVRVYLDRVSSHEMSPDRPATSAFVNACGDLAEALETAYGDNDVAKPGDREAESPASIISTLDPQVRAVLVMLVSILALANHDELDRLRKLFGRLPGLVQDAGASRDVAAYVRRCGQLIAPAGQQGLES
jgi:hypothetical protein